MKVTTIKILLTLILGLFYSNIFAQSFEGVKWAQIFYCYGEYQIRVSSFGAAFNEDNIFTIELSDSTGDFTNSFILGDSLKNESTYIKANFSTAIPKGGNYAMRVVSSSPALISDTTHSFAISNSSLYKATLDTIERNPSCYGELVKFEGNIEFGKDNIVWSTGEKGPYTSWMDTVIENFYYSGTDNNACPFSSDTIKVSKFPVLDLGLPDSMDYCSDHLFDLEINQSGKVTWYNLEYPNYNIVNKNSLKTSCVLYNDGKNISYHFTDTNQCNYKDSIYSCAFIRPC